MKRLKNFLLYSIILSLISLSLFPVISSPVLAIPQCGTEASGVAYSPTYFAPETNPITINFVINPNVVNNFINQTPPNDPENHIRLRLYGGVIQANQYIDGTPVPLVKGQTNYTLSVNDPKLGSAGSFYTISIIADGANGGICDGGKIQIGIKGGSCLPDPNLPKDIPPESKVTIKFLGEQNKKYYIFLASSTLGVTGLSGFLTQLGSATTNNAGQGSFVNLAVPGSNGDNVTLNIGTTDKEIGADAPSCQVSFKLIATAAPPPPPGSGPVQPGNTGTASNPALNCTGSDCTQSSGQTCDPGNGTYGTGGIMTAIGCVPISISQLLPAILRVALLAAGGIALLLMAIGALGMILSNGNPEALKSARARFTSAAIGLIFVIFSVLLLKIIGANLLGINAF